MELKLSTNQGNIRLEKLNRLTKRKYGFFKAKLDAVLWRNMFCQTIQENQKDQGN